MNWKSEKYALFAEQLGQLLESGIPITQSLSVLAEQKIIPQTWVQEMLIQLHEGSSFSIVLQNVKFPPLFVSFIQSAEEHGDYVYGLKQIKAFYRSKGRWLNEVRQACIYPVFVIAFVLFSFAFMTIFVLPRFSQLYLSFGIELPFVTEFLFVLFEYLPWIIVIGVLLALLLLISKKVKPLQLYFYRLPFVNQIYQFRWTHYTSLQLGSLLKAGVPLLSALELMERISPWSLVAIQFTKMRTQLLNGCSFHESIQRSSPQIFLTSFPQMIALAEQTGKLSETLIRTANTTETLMRNKVEKIVKGLEPLFMLLIGGFVALTVIGLFLPMLGLVQAL